MHGSTINKKQKEQKNQFLEEKKIIDEEVKRYSFSWKALSRFKKLLRTPSWIELDEYFLRQYDGSIATGAYALPEILGPIYEEFFGVYNIVDDNKFKLNKAQKRYLVVATCCVLHHMRMTKVVDVTKETISDWLGWIRLAERCGRLNVGSIAENIKKVWEAHYYIQAKKIVDEKTSRLERELEQVSMYKAELRTKMDELWYKMDEVETRYRELQRMDKEQETYSVVGSRGPMKKVRSDALEIKWRSCYDSLVTHPGNLSAK